MENIEEIINNQKERIYEVCGQISQNTTDKITSIDGEDFAEEIFAIIENKKNQMDSALKNHFGNKISDSVIGMIDNARSIETIDKERIEKIADSVLDEILKETENTDIENAISKAQLKTDTLANITEQIEKGRIVKDSEGKNVRVGYGMIDTKKEIINTITNLKKEFDNRGIVILPEQVKSIDSHISDLGKNLINMINESRNLKLSKIENIIKEIPEIIKNPNYVYETNSVDEDNNSEIAQTENESFFIKIINFFKNIFNK